ncbi:hypothetical protein AAHN97_14970 [Chitinophaga niabensis]|uniref:hypothetical protein n=1 Tax=Chitinophaga niabensis TaxID=536979 RepID=UPI0031BA5406
MAYPTGQYYIDGADLWLVYGMIIEDRAGTDALLQFPERKESISHDWADENGLDIDLSRVYLKEKEFSLNISIQAAGESDFWDKYHKFLNMLRQPGLRRLEVSELASSYFVFYKSCTSFARRTRIKGSSKIAAQFSITLVEPSPQLDSTNVYIMDEEGRFLIT